MVYGYRITSAAEVDAQEEPLNRRTVFAMLGAAALLGTMIPGAVVAKSPTRSFERLDISNIDPELRPALLDTGRMVTVMLQLRDQPALARTDLSRAEQRAVARELRQTQDRLDASIRRAGGKVLAKFQAAYNGIKVRASLGDVPELAKLPGVEAVRAVRVYTPDNTRGVPYIGAPAAWQDLGATGAGTGIAVIDTGIDYNHADLGGSGIVADFTANDPTVIEAGTFPTAKVVGGYDFVGNAYDASDEVGSPTPVPDADPLDCNGHGSHVSGTAAGTGENADGTAYTGPYDSTTHATAFKIGPGVAPQARLFALKVFGCDGSTDVVVEALEWVADYNLDNGGGIDVVNMSLGSVFGRATDPDAVATDVLVRAGVVVVASAGNSGPSAYITGSPAAADGALSTAAIDTTASFPTASISIGSGIQAINANGATIPAAGITAPIKVLLTSAGGIALGCKAADYAGVAGTIVVTKRGTCARVDRAILGQAAGAVAVIMVNSSDTLPPFEGEIPGVTIPFLGVKSSATAALMAANGTSVTITAGSFIDNPDYRKNASFTSGGPRNGDSAAKPDITAPGVSIESVASGGGTASTRLSGTSMAAPHAAGVAALVAQKNPGWTAGQIKAAMMNTADASATGIIGYNVRLNGAGLVQPRRAANSVALAMTGDVSASLSFGYEPLGAAYTETKSITITNTSAAAITYNLAGAFVGPGWGAAIGIAPTSVPVAANATASVDVTLTMTAGAVAALRFNSVLLGQVGWGGVNAASGVIVATPQAAGDGIYSLRVPFTLVPRGLSDIQASAKAAWTKAQGIARTSVQLTNPGIHAGFADVYTWSLTDPAGDGFEGMDVRSVGVQSIAAENLTGEPDPNDRGLLFAINNEGRASTAVVNEFDIAIDTNNNKKPDFFLVGVDFGAVTAGSFDGRMASFLFDPAGNIVTAWVAESPPNSSTIILPVLASELGLKKGNSDFNFSLTAFSLDTGAVDGVGGTARFDSHKPAVSTGDFIPVAPGGVARLDLAVDIGKFASAPTKGWLVVTLDDANGPGQANEIPIGPLP